MELGLGPKKGPPESAGCLCGLVDSIPVKEELYGDIAGGPFQRGRVGDDHGDLLFTMPGGSYGVSECQHIRVRLLGTVPSLLRNPP